MFSCSSVHVVFQCMTQRCLILCMKSVETVPDSGSNAVVSVDVGSVHDSLSSNTSVVYSSQ